MIKSNTIRVTNVTKENRILFDLINLTMGLFFSLSLPLLIL